MKYVHFMNLPWYLFIADTNVLFQNW